VDLLVLLTFFGLATGAIAKVKGSSFLLWFVIGFALPTIGVIIALLYRNERYEPKRRCPNCNKVVPVYDQVCMRCGEDLDLPAELAATPSR
jgi:hypothetical protein